jgi:hypothetical protein
MGIEAAELLNNGVAFDKIERWDVYDVADELADVAPVLQSLVAAPFPWNSFRDDILGVIADLKDLERRLWEAAKRGGSVGPYPEYSSV